MSEPKPPADAASAAGGPPAEHPGAPPPRKDAGTGLSRFGSLPPFWKWVFAVLVTAGLALFIIRNFNIIIAGRVFEINEYYYLLYMVFLLPVFLGSPARKKDKKRLPWYDVVLGLIGTGLAFYFLLNRETIDFGLWTRPPTTTVFVAGLVMLLLALEAGRRIGGKVFLTVCIFFGTYPLYASLMPDPFFGRGLSFQNLVGQFAYTSNGMIGLPIQVNGDLLIGYLFFSGIMAASGAGRFFLDFAVMVMGRFRGGPAKVAVVSSALFGSLSGSGVANLAFTGSFTIPAMKRLGYPPHYAGAIEACASTGSSITPPVMGTIAFVMAILTGIDYAIIVIAAVIPAVLYYTGLIIQVDGYAARNGLTGLKRDEIPSVKEVFGSGWIVILALGFLVWAIVIRGWTAQGPVLTGGILIGYAFVVAMVWGLRDKGWAGSFFQSSVGRFLLFTFPSEHRMSRQKASAMVGEAGGIMAWMVGVLLPVGFLLTGIYSTGTIGSLISRIVLLSEANSFIILLVAFLACFMMGLMGLALIPYVFLGVTMAPAVVRFAGLDVVAVHLFLVYCILIAAISPPVAIMSFVGASIAGAPPIKTALMSVRLGIVLMFLPFFFVYSPALLFRGPLIELVWLLPQVVAGIWILTSGLEGYVLKIGAVPFWARPLLVIGGFLLAMPFLVYVSAAIGGAIIAVTLLAVLLTRKTKLA